MCTKKMIHDAACTKIFWYTQRRVSKFIYLLYTSMYNFVYHFFDTYCIMYRKCGTYFDTYCNMYHFFDTWTPMYQKYQCIKIFWYITPIFSIHHCRVPKIWYIFWYRNSDFDTQQFGDHSPSIWQIETKLISTRLYPCNGRNFSTVLYNELSKQLQFYMTVLERWFTPTGPSTIDYCPARKVPFGKRRLSARTSDSLCAGFQHWMTQG